MSSTILNSLRSVGRSARIAATLCLTAASLTCSVFVVVSGLTPRSLRHGGPSFALVDISKVEMKVRGDRFQGLPDAHDFSKHKDFYTIQLWNYCSGKLQNDDYIVDFCSKPRQSLFDLFGFWKSWGVSVQKEGRSFYWLEQGPKLLYVSYLIATSTKVFELLVGLPSLFSNRGNLAIVALSAVASGCVLITSIVTQVMYGQLISRADDEDIPITAKKASQINYAANWVATVCSFFALALWCQIVFGNTIKRAATLEKPPSTPIRAANSDDPRVRVAMRRRTWSKYLPN